MNHRLWLGGALAALAAIAGAAPGMTFAPGAILDWESHSFEGQTRYELVGTDQGEAIHARCEGASASGLFRRETVNLKKTPVIEWRWRVDEPINAGDETRKSGDDFAARIYAVDEYSYLRWRTRAISYVWASEQPAGSAWENPHQSRAHMVAVASGSPEKGDDGWRTQRRNLREDFSRFHDRDLEEINVIAIMTDCDDTGESTEAWYGDIRFLPADGG